jgi:hypothetical protein
VPLIAISSPSKVALTSHLCTSSLDHLPTSNGQQDTGTRSSTALAAGWKS